MSTFDEYIPGRFDHPLAAAQAENTRGRRAIGYLSDDVPVELILAADALPVRIDVVGLETTSRADGYLESSFGPMSRSCLEQWLRGDLDFLDAVVFPRSNDSAQRLYYYICELQRRRSCAGPTPLIYDVARIDRDTSRRHTIAAANTLASQLGTVASKLEAANLRICNRAAFARRLSSVRTSAKAIRGSDAFQAWNALQLDWSERFEANVREWLSVAERQLYAKRILIAGSTPPDARLHRAVETGGGNIVDEFFDGSIAQCSARWVNAGLTTEAIANAYRAARTTAVAWRESPNVLVERAQTAGAQGVILWLIEEDEGIVWELPKQVERLRAAGIEVLTLTRQSWNAAAPALASLERFVQHLGAAA